MHLKGLEVDVLPGVLEQVLKQVLLDELGGEEGNHVVAESEVHDLLDGGLGLFEVQLLLHLLDELETGLVGGDRRDDLADELEGCLSDWVEAVDHEVECILHHLHAQSVEHEVLHFQFGVRLEHSLQF